MSAFSGEIWINVIASIIASAILLGAGFLWGKYKERHKFGRKLEDYDFYPLVFSLPKEHETLPHHWR